MPLSAQDRIARDRAAPRIVALHHALTALRSLAGFLQSGAHPDDEMSAMLAALRLRDGLSLAYVCSTRGDGGHNDIGMEAGADLAALRMAEMEAPPRCWTCGCGGCRPGRTTRYTTSAFPSRAGIRWPAGATPAPATGSSR